MNELRITKTSAVLSVVAPGTFDAMGIPLRRGRDFHDGDTYDAPFTAIINESLGRISFPGQDPIGHSIYCGLDSLKPMRIVGVVGDIRQYGPASEPSPEIFMPYLQHPQPSTSLNLVVRTTAGFGSLPETIRRKARELSSDVPVKFTTLESYVADNVAAPRFRTLLLAVFATLAVCLAMAGVYAVMAYVVGQRSSEIGLRMALGAASGDVLRLVLRQGVAYAALGVAIGLAASLAATRLLEGLLFGVQPNDPWIYGAVATLAALVTLAACVVPALRAARVDPLVALREE
jgi:predicted permease